MRSSKLIGQLANCPKCNSLVMIAVPQQITVDAPDGKAVDSTALTREVLPPDAPPRDFSNTTEDEYRLAPEPTQHIAAQAGDSISQSWQPSESPLLPSEQWTSPATTQTRQYLVIGFIGLSGILLAVLGFVAFLNWYPKKPTEQTLTAQGSPDAISPQQEDVAAVNQDITPLDAPELQLPDDSATELEASQGSSVEVTEPANRFPEAVDDSDGPKIEELAGPTNVDRPDALEEATANPPNNEIAANTLAPQLQSLAPFLNIEYVPEIPEEGVVTTKPPVTAEDLGLAMKLVPDPVPQIDWESYASTQLTGLLVRSPEPTLSQMVNLWTHLSGVPTVVDLDSLAAAGIDRNQSVHLPLIKRTSVRDAAGIFAKTIGAIIEPKENRYLEFRASPADIQSHLPKSISLSGLIDEGDIPWLQKELQHLFPGQAAALIVQASEVTYDNTQIDLGSWFSVVRFFETWRSAKGQAMAMETQFPGQLVSNFVVPDSVAAMNTKLTIVSPQSRPVGQVLTKVCREAGIQCWIDWANVGQVGLGPQTEAVVVTHGRTLRSVLADYGDLFGLETAFLDNQSIWITTRIAYRLQSQLYVLPRQDRSIEQWEQVLRPLTPAKSGQSIGMVEVTETPDQQYIIVRCCRPKEKARFE
ncbi:MAG: hypothetical protein KDB22_15395 [Planctomycetales bacterium]|nr:hypothetical protein [Planctomycetales bacterium]